MAAKLPRISYKEINVINQSAKICFKRNYFKKYEIYINLENKFNVNLGKMKAEDDIFINCEMKEEIKTELDPECVMTDGSILKIEKKEEYFNQKGIYPGNFLVYDVCPPPPASYYFVHGS